MVLAALVYRAQVKPNGQYLKTSASLAANEDLITLLARQAELNIKTSHNEVAAHVQMNCRNFLLIRCRKIKSCLRCIKKVP